MNSAESTESPGGFTALMVACQFGHFDIIKLLLQYGAKPNIVGCGVTALDLLLLRPHDTSVDECVRLLLQHGANPLLTPLGRHTVHQHAALKEWLCERVTAASISLKRNHLNNDVVDLIVRHAFTTQD